MTWVDLVAGILTGIMGAAIAYFLSRGGKAVVKIAAIDPPKTTSAQDDQTTHEATTDAIISATDESPDANPDVVSNLVGLADRER